MKLSETMLANIAALADATYHPAGDPPYVCVLAGRGEIVLDENSEGFFLTWDRTNAIDECIDLDFPEMTSPHAYADCLLRYAEDYKDH